MNSQESKHITEGILKALAISIAVLIVLFFLYTISSVIVYIAISGVISLIGRPVVKFFRSKLKFNNLLSVIITMVLLLGVLLGTAALFIPLIESQGDSLALLNYEELEQNFQRLTEEINTYLVARNIDAFETVKVSDVLSRFNVSSIPDFLNSFLSMVGSLSIGLFSVLFISFFFLKDSKLLGQILITMAPTRNESRVRKSFDKIKDLLSRYFVGLVFQILILFIIYTVVLFVFGIKNALVIAFLCALLNLIPYVGPLIGGVIMLILSMSSNLGQDFQEIILPKTSYVMIGYLVAQLVDNFISQPLIFSNSVRSHPLEIFLVIVIAGLLFGVVGMIVAIPTYTVLKVIAQEFLSSNKIVAKMTKDL